MRRRLFIAVACAVVCGCASAAGAGAQTDGQAAADFQLDAAHDGFQPQPGFTVPLRKKWTVTEPYALGNYPLIANGAIYAVLGQSLVAISLRTGHILWQDQNFAPSYPVPGLAYDRGEIFSLTGQQAYDQVSAGQSAGSGTLKAFNAATGAVEWSAALPGEYSFTTPPTASRGYVYVAGEGWGALVYAVSEATGHVAWTRPLDGGDSSPAVTASGVYVEGGCNEDYAFSPLSGALLWHHASNCEGGATSIAVAAAGRFYGFEEANPAVILSAASGRQIGSFPSRDPAPLPAPAVGDGHLYMLSGGVVTAISKSGLGGSSWSFSGTNDDLVTSPQIAGNLVFEGSSTGTLYALNAYTGAERWSASFPHQYAGGNFAIGDGSLVVSSGEDLTAYAGRPTSSASAGTPKNLRRPTLPRRAAVRSPVRARAGRWKPTPTGYRYQWMLCNRRGRRCHTIPHAAARVFRPARADLGHDLRVRVFARDFRGYSMPATSRPSVIERTPTRHSG